MTTKRYLVVIEQDASGTYGAYSPDVPGCVSAGDTPEEALTSYRSALETWIEATLAEGSPIPDPSSHAAEVDIDVPVNATSTR